MKPVLVGGLIGLVIAWALGYNSIYARQQGHARLKRTQIVQEQANHQAREEAAKFLEQLEQYRRQLPPEPDTSWIVREAISAAQKAGLELTSIAQDAPRESAPFTHLTVNFQFTATYHQLGTFLDYLEQSNRFIRVERLTVAGVDATRASEEQPSIQLTLSTLYVPPLLAKGG